MAHEDTIKEGINLIYILSRKKTKKTVILKNDRID